MKENTELKYELTEMKNCTAKELTREASVPQMEEACFHLNVSTKIKLSLDEREWVYNVGSNGGKLTAEGSEKDPWFWCGYGAKNCKKTKS